MARSDTSPLVAGGVEVVCAKGLRYGRCSPRTRQGAVCRPARRGPPRPALRHSQFSLPRHEHFESVIAAAKTGAEWAIASLYREFGPGLLRYLRAQAPADGEDLASGVWMNVAAGLGRFEGEEAAFRAGMFSIARRRVIDSRRREERRRKMLNSLEPT